MRIVKMSVEDYLKQLGFTQEEIDRFAPKIVDEYTLRDVLNANALEYLWDYHPMDLDELIEREEQMQSIDDWKDKEDTYVYLFDRLWEVEE